MKFRPVTIAACLAVLAVAARPAQAGNDGLVPAAPQTAGEQHAGNVGIDQNLGAQVNLDLVFRDESERPITLREAMQGKVTILVPVYYRCPMLCTRTLNGLLEGLRAFPPDFSVGNQFNVVTVSMDPKEHADLGSAKKAAYLAEYGRPGAEAGWRFLTGKKEPVGELLKTVGYRYEFDKAFKEYNHASGIVILTPEGKVSRYFLGIGFDDKVQPGDAQAAPLGTPPAPSWRALRLSLVEASGGKIGTLADQLTLVCYRFDHLSQGYALRIMRVVQVAGIVTLLLMGTWVTLALRRERPVAGAVATAPAVNETDKGTQNGQPGVTA